MSAPSAMSNASAALTQLLERLSFSHVLAYGAIALLALFIADFASLPRYPEQIPMLGHGRGCYANVRNSIAYFTRHQSWIKEGYVKYGKKDLPFIAPAPISRPPDVILPRSQIAWMMEQSDRVLSAHQAHNSILYSEYNFLGQRLANEPFANRVAHKYLARNVSGAISDVEDEVISAVDAAFGTDTEEWTSLNLWDTWLKIVPRVTSRLLVGLPVCRDEKFLQGMVSFTDDVVRNSFLLHMFPHALHPIFGRLFTIPNWLHWNSASKSILPVIKKRLHDMKRKDADDAEYKNWTPPEDFITWTIRLAMAEGNKLELDPATISKRLLPIEFASIHTTVLTGQSWMLDFLTTPPEEGVVEMLRDELRSNKPASGGWTKAALSSLTRVDSSIRESQRLSNFAATLVERRVVAPEGLHNPAYGWTLPRGSFLTVNLQETHHDPDMYENPNTYDALRYAREREAWENKPEAERKQDESEGTRVRGLGMVTTSDRHLAFGHGRHACPGRFFVAHELKLIMAQILLNYDIKMLDERPKPMWIGGTIVPPLKACVEVRRRKGTV